MRAGMQQEAEAQQEAAEAQPDTVEVSERAAGCMLQDAAPKVEEP